MPKVQPWRLKLNGDSLALLYPTNQSIKLSCIIILLICAKKKIANDCPKKINC